MMNERSALSDHEHEQLQLLLPWYVTGQLVAGECTLIERHLAHCTECRAELAGERSLREIVATFPRTIQPDWTLLARRTERRSSVEVVAGLFTTANAWLGRVGAQRVSLGWAVLPQAASALLIAAVLMPGRTPTYVTQGSATGPAAANAMIMFRPETREGDLRRILAIGGARLVDGPTEAGAYLLRIPPDRRVSLLPKLRREPLVTLVEPVDAATS